MINNSADAFFCPRSLSINMLQNKNITQYFWNTGSHILFIQQVCLHHNSRQSIRIILIGWDKYNQPMKIFRRNSFGCCNVNKGLQTKDGLMISGSYFVKYCFWSRVLLRNHGQKNASAQLFIMILPSSIRLLQRIDNTIFKREGKHHFLKKYTYSGLFFGT